MVRRIVVAAALGALALVCSEQLGSRLRAQIRSTVVTTEDGRRVHIMPAHEAGITPQPQRQQPDNGSTLGFATVFPSAYDSSPLIDHAGGEMSQPGVLSIYWNSSVADSASTSPGYATISSQVNAFVNAFADNLNWRDVSTADYTIVQQYGRTTSISPALANRGSIILSQATESTISDGQLVATLQSLFAAHSLARDSSTIYSIFLPPNMQVTGVGGPFCAYHGSFYDGGVAIKYAVYLYLNFAGCTAGDASVGDNLTVAISHETREAVTDPTGTGWFDADGNEADDKCAWHNLYRTARGGFLVQPEWSNGGVVTASGFTASYPGPGCVVPANVVRRTFGDFDGDGRADIAMFRPSTGAWSIDNNPSQSWGIAGDIPVPADYAGIGRMQIAIFRPSTGEWFIQGQSGIQFGAPGDIPVPADYNGDGRADIAVFRPSTGAWFILGQASVSWGAAGDIPVPGDYGGVGHAQIAVFRRGTWFVVGQPAIQWGAAGDIPVPADYDGDGTVDPAIFRRGSGWYVRNQFVVAFGAGDSLPVPLDIDGDGRAELMMYSPGNGNWCGYTTFTGQQTGCTSSTIGDIPVELALTWRRPVRGDADGDGRADLMVFRPTTAQWLTFFPSGGSSETILWGSPGDTPVPGDFRGTHTTDAAVFNNGVWAIRGGPTLNWGTAGDVPVVADFDGDGRSDVAVFRNGEWYILYSSSSFASQGVFVWGTNRDLPIAADFDGDGKADLAVFRSGTWYLLTSSSDYAATSARTVLWGTAGDIPVVADYDGDGAADVAVFRPSTGTWYIRRSSDGSVTTAVFGNVPGDIPVAADYDGDGRADIAIYRPSTGTWYVMGQFSVVFGTATDFPAAQPSR